MTRSSVFSFLKFFLGWPLSLTAVYFLCSKTYLQLQKNPIELNSLNFSALLISILCFLFYFFLRSYSWYKILRYYKHPVGFYTTQYHWAASELKRYIPGNLWSFAARGLRFSEMGVTKKDLTKALLLEAELIVVGSLIVSLPSLLFLLHEYIPSLSKITILLCAILGVSLILLLFAYQNIFYKYFSKSLSEFLLSPFSSTKHLRLALISAASYTFYGLGSYFAVSALLYLNPAFTIITASGLVLAYLAGYLSLITPSGLGVRELIAAAILGSLTFSPALGAAVILARVLSMLSELLFLTLSLILARHYGHKI